MIKLISNFALCLAVAVMVSACRSTTRSDRPAPTTQPAPSGMRNARVEPNAELPLPVAQASTPIAKGPTPLVYLYDLGGPVRVVDSTTGAQIASAVAPARSIVRVDDRHGVTVGSLNVSQGPLPAGHQYVIYLDPETDNVFRRSVGTSPRVRP